MACEHAQMWNLSGLVAAFLDLGIAYLLLCASALVYLASKFMGFFGLRLPCPCDGMFCNIRSRSLCLNRILVDLPSLKVTDVQLSVKQKFPFSHSASSHQRYIDQNTEDDGILGDECEASCSSLSDAKLSAGLSMREMNPSMNGHRLRSRMSGHRKGRRLSSLSSLGRVLHLEDLDTFYGQEGSKRNITRPDDTGLDVEADDLDCIDKAPLQYGDSGNGSSDGSLHTDPKSVFPEMQIDDSGDDKHFVKVLEQELEAERRAHATLYAELEKERSAAAGAADEALAMILRLQEEKASMDMESRQFQRIIEEKFAYDAEEINILKEILVRKEKEKHDLEKEVEVYRQMASSEDVKNSRDVLDEDDARRLACLPFDPNDDPILVLRHLAASPNWKERKPESELMSSCGNGNGSLDLHEKEIISVGNFVQSIPEILQNCKQSFSQEAKELGQIQEGCEMNEKIIETCPCLQQAESLNRLSDNGSGSNVVCDLSSSVRDENYDDASSGLPLEQRSVSLSSLDGEMLMIDNEVGLLQERLKLVQIGREKIRPFGETQARGSINLKLLEDIVLKLQAIRPFAEPGKAVRQMSLPPPPTKVYSRKRRSRSVSSGFQ